MAKRKVAIRSILPVQPTDLVEHAVEGMKWITEVTSRPAHIQYGRLSIELVPGGKGARGRVVPCKMIR